MSMSYDVEFQVHDLGIWFRVNDNIAEDESEAIQLARKKLLMNTGIDIDSYPDYWIEIPYTDTI